MHQAPSTNHKEQRDNDSEVLVRVENLGKIFCRDLKKSLWYGLKDGMGELVPGIKGRQYDTNGDPILRQGEFWSNQGINFELRRGECLGLIGHNGAGKTTLLKMLNGLIKPDVGKITMHGRVGALIALGAGFNPILTGRENVYIAGSVYGLTKAEIDAKYDEIVEFAELQEFMESPVQNYSSGMQVRLGFAVASALRPDVMLLDEVLAVGDVAFQAKCYNRLADMRREGVPFILVSHNMHQIARYCHKVVYLRRGQIEFVGDAEEGIGCFLEEMNESSGGRNSGPDWSVVHGSGKVVLTGCEFLDANNKINNTLNAGKPFKIKVSFETRHSEEIKDPVLDLVIISQGQELFRGTSKSFGSYFGKLPRLGNFVITFDSMPSNHESATVNMSLTDAVTGEFFDWKRDIKFSVCRDLRQSGSLAVDAKWEITQVNAT